MQVVQNAVKAILVFCLALVIIVGSPLSAQASPCYMQPNVVDFNEISPSPYGYEARLSSLRPVKSLDIGFVSQEDHREVITLVSDPFGQGETVKNLEVTDPTQAETGVFDDARPFKTLSARVYNPSDIQMVILNCEAAN